MKYLLLPKWCRPVGWVLLIYGIVAGIWYISGICDVNGWKETLLIDSCLISILLSAVCIVCARLKREDEFSSATRLVSLLYSFYIIAILAILGCVIFNGMDFILYLCVMMALCPILFVAIFCGLKKRNDILYGKEV